MEMLKWQIEQMIIFWECEKGDRIQEGHDSLMYEDYEQCEYFISKLKSFLEEI